MGWFRRWFGRSDATPAAGLADGERVGSSSAAHGTVPWNPAIDVEVPFVRWLLDAPAHGPPVLDAAEHVVLAALDAAIASDDASALVPRVPAVVPQLLHDLRDRRRSAGALAQQIAQDAVVAASVVRAANSAGYRTTRAIESLDQAVLVLGDDGLRQVVASVAFRPLIDVQSGVYARAGAPRIWAQSQLAALACRTLAAGAGANAFEAYLASLLHNVSHVVALRILDRNRPSTPLPASAAFCAAFIARTRDLAVVIGRRWQFPPQVAQAVDADSATPLAMLVTASDRLGKLRMLCDAGWIDADEALRALDGHHALGECFGGLAIEARPAAHHQ
jgi:HD-like signal output (HDOD) protein